MPVTSDYAADLLTKHMHQQDKPGLCVVDEALHAALHHLPATQWRYLTNRHDVWQQITRDKPAASAQFNDFDIGAELLDGTSGLFFRIAKEKAVNHHIINQAIALLSPGQTLSISGMKQEGIKSLTERCQQLLGPPLSVMNGKKSSRLVIFQRTDADINARLDDDDYTRLREIARIDNHPIVSKPGQFGWQKVDQGSELLCEHFAALATPTQAHQLDVLDLGCGYGYLTIRAALYGFGHIVATDNNAAAVHSCAHNIEALQLPAQVIADDCARHIDPCFDIIVCNPPFHRGFDTSRDLTRHFLAQIQRLLKPTGQALLVVNRFIQVEAVAQTLFRRCSQVACDAHFKLLLLSHPQSA